MLLQHSNGAFQLLVREERVKGTNAVTIVLGGNRDSVKVYAPTIGIESIETHSHNAVLSLTLSDHPLSITIPGQVNQPRGER